uniref:Uncharacterized protein n=1 Tax=Pithovirus LCPAC403 TaxID=2506596 RepID=A0A481ZBJ9_9VIRU|nr:MAG: uncharacterized protein LCPAC403_04220 [Pithovirus LCPAC403]
MTYIVCSKNNKYLPIFCEYDVNLIIFLDKRNSLLIVRERKNSQWYKSHKYFIPKENETGTFREYHKFTIYGQECYAYNGDEDYFVRLDIDTKDALELRIHPDFISYVNETDQEDLEVVNVAGGKKLTMLNIGDNLLSIVVMSDGDCEII